MKVENTCSIVTGGSKGIGRAIVELMVSKGGNVVIGDVLDKEGEELANTLNRSGKNKVKFVHCDVRKLEDLKNLFNVATEEFGGAQIMFNNAGINEPDYPYSDLERSIKVFQINLGAVFTGTLLAQEHFNGQLKADSSKQFCIINTGSVGGLTPCIEFPFYSFTKNSVWHFTHIMSQLKWNNIRISCIAPGYTRTDILKDDESDDTEVVEAAMGLMEPSYIAQKMFELIEDDSANGVVKFVQLDGDKFADKINVISFKEEIEGILSSREDGNVPMN